MDVGSRVERSHLHLDSSRVEVIDRLQVVQPTRHVVMVIDENRAGRWHARCLRLIEVLHEQLQKNEVNPSAKNVFPPPIYHKLSNAMRRAAGSLPKVHGPTSSICAVLRLPVKHYPLYLSLSYSNNNIIL